jgi:hypothetical protein
MPRAPLLLALAPQPACGARAGAHAAYCRPDRRHAGQGAGEQAQPDAESGIPVTGMARSRLQTATHPVPAVRGSSVGPLSVTAAGMPAAYAADLIWHMAGRYRPPDAPRRPDTLTQADPPAAMIARQPD